MHREGWEAEGEGFEPSSDETARNGFRDRRIRPLCHPSTESYGQRNRVAASFRGLKPPRERVPFDLPGEVAEWLKAAPC
jgi:hypothetical protein